MAIERKRYKQLAVGPDTTSLSLVLTYTASGTSWACTAGDKSLVSSITTNGTGDFTVNLKQVGYSLIGVEAMPVVAAPGTTKIQSLVVKAYSASAKTLNMVCLKGDGSAVAPDDQGVVYLTLRFRDSVGA